MILSITHCTFKSLLSPSTLECVVLQWLYNEERFYFISILLYMCVCVCVCVYVRDIRRVRPQSLQCMRMISEGDGSFCEEKRECLTVKIDMLEVKTVCECVCVCVCVCVLVWVCVCV